MSAEKIEIAFQKGLENLEKAKKIEKGEEKGDSQHFYREAINFLGIAAEEKPEAMFLYALLKKKGNGFSKNIKQYQDFLTKAADKWHPEAAYNLATHYFLGTVFKEDPEQYRKYIKIAADNGHKDARSSFKSYIYNTKEKYHIEDIKFLIDRYEEKLTDLNIHNIYIASSFFVSEEKHYLNNFVDLVDFAFKKNNISTLFKQYLFQTLENDINFVENSLNKSKAQYFLGLCYKTGIGEGDNTILTQDDQKALKYFTNAASGGNRLAIDHINELKPKDCLDQIKEAFSIVKESDFKMQPEQMFI